ncbi:Development-specific protein S [Thalassocella blandensis]|nr:Development-specific protein S [Thalassocella blandensis]
MQILNNLSIQQSFLIVALLCFLNCAQAEKIQAENYTGFNDLSEGNSGGAYRNDAVDIEPSSDIEAGFNVGWIDATEWLSYADIEINSTGKYRIRLRVASPEGAVASVDLNGNAISLGNFEIPATGGWQNWVDVEREVELVQGTYDLGVYAVTSGWNFNWIAIEAIDDAEHVATVFQHCDFNGWAVALAEGEYSLSQLTLLGISNDAISSIQVNENYEVEIFENDNFSGLNRTLSGSDSCLVNEGFNDLTTSLIVRKRNSVPVGGRAASIPVGIENVNDSPLKAANYRAMIRFVPPRNISIDRFYFGFKLRGASCWDFGNAGYGAGDGGTMQAQLVNIDPQSGLPGSVISSETINACTRHNQAKAEVNDAIPVLVWANTPADLSAGTMYGFVLRNIHNDPSNNFFSLNTPLADVELAGPHARNELNANAVGALLSMDPREHVAWSSDSGASWQYGFYNGQYRSYMNDRDLNHPATRLPQYGYRLRSGAMLAGQPYYAYSTDCTGCTATFLNVKVSRVFSELGAFTASGVNVGKLTIRNITTGESGTCTPPLGYGFRTCDLNAPIRVNAGDNYSITASGSVETMEMDWSQRQMFPAVGTANGDHPIMQDNPGAGTGSKDVPSVWAGPLSAYFNN